MKKIIASLVIVGAVSAAVVGATRAVWFGNHVLGSNTFSTGTVKFGEFSSYANVSVTNLMPSVWSNWVFLRVPYIGTLPADIYAGVGGCSSNTDPNYIADVLDVQIRRSSDQGETDGTLIWNKKANLLSSQWLKTETSVNSGVYWYALRFRLNLEEAKRDPNLYQGRTNTDTAFIMHAVETGGAKPTEKPFIYLRLINEGYCTTWPWAWEDVGMTAPQPQ